jgi:hypothetical protein
MRVALAIVALQRLGEKGAQRLADHRVEDVGLDAGLDVEHRGRGAAVTTDRRLAHRHLVERR